MLPTLYMQSCKGERNLTMFFGYIIIREYAYQRNIYAKEIAAYYMAWCHVWTSELRLLSQELVYNSPLADGLDRINLQIVVTNTSGLLKSRALLHLPRWLSPFSFMATVIALFERGEIS